MGYSKGSVIHGYELTTNFSNKGGGRCEWAFARKNGTEYFIKRFLKPVYLESSSTCGGKVVTIPPLELEKNHRDCLSFENQNKQVQNLLIDYSGGGNLIVATDFFREGTKYYKVAHRVNVAAQNLEQICNLPFDQRLMLLTTLTHSLSILHKVNLVHGDLKPDNVIIKQTPKFYVAALIDFDDSYFSGCPTLNRDELVGDMNYYSPELGLYYNEDEEIQPKDLTCKSDIFALGIIFCQYLTGKMPVFNPEYINPYIAVLNGETLRITSDSLPRWLQNLVNLMLRQQPKHRPDIVKIFDSLKNRKEVIHLETGPLEPPLSDHSGPPPRDPPPPTTGSTLRGTLTMKKTAPPSSGGDAEEKDHVLEVSTSLKGTSLRKS